MLRGFDTRGTLMKKSLIILVVAALIVTASVGAYAYYGPRGTMYGPRGGMHGSGWMQGRGPGSRWGGPGYMGGYGHRGGSGYMNGYGHQGGPGYMDGYGHRGGYNHWNTKQPNAGQPWWWNTPQSDQNKSPAGQQ